jgi:outer membrane protein OmpA-like peptidoglycan-associated protein
MMKPSEQTPTTGPTATVGGPYGRTGAGFTGPKDVKVPPFTKQEMGLIVGVIITVGLLIGGYWFYSQRGETEQSADKSPTPVSSGPLVTPAVAAPVPSASAQTPVDPKPETVHADLYFDFNRSRLRADAVTILQEQAQILKKDGGWVVMVQGYSDQHGPAEYNKGLAKRRAETVKEFLVQLGVPESSIKVISLGQAGMICDDGSKECQKLNRRVHLEMTKVGAPSTEIAESITPSSPTH